MHQNSPTWLTLHVALLIHPHIRKFPASEVTNLTTKQFFYPFNTFSVSESYRISPCFHSSHFQNAAFTSHSQFIGVNLQGHFLHVSHSGMVQPHSRHRGVVFLLRCTDCSQSPLLSPSWQPKNCIGRPDADPSCPVTCISLRLAAAGM
jgi:hypothetical protein